MVFLLSSAAVGASAPGWSRALRASAPGLSCRIHAIHRQLRPEISFGWARTGGVQQRRPTWAESCLCGCWCCPLAVACCTCAPWRGGLCSSSKYQRCHASDSDFGSLKSPSASRNICAEWHNSWMTLNVTQSRLWSLPSDTSMLKW